VEKVMEKFTRLTIGSLTGFAQAPHPDCRMVIGHVGTPGFDACVHAGWLMPQVSEVDSKTARFYAEKERRNG
jgi:hypothetical protein